MSSTLITNTDNDHIDDNVDDDDNDEDDGMVLIMIFFVAAHVRKLTNEMGRV